MNYRVEKNAVRFASLALAALCAYNARAQSAPAATDPIQIGGVTFTGSLRSRVYFWDWFQPASGNNSYDFSGNILRLGFSQNRGAWDWNAEFAVPFLLGLPANATGTGPQQGALGFGSNYFTSNSGSQNTAMIFPKQLYIRLDDLGGDRRQTFQIGRFEFADGTEVTPKNGALAGLKRDRVGQRLIGTFAFSDVGRSFDGVHYSFGSASDNFTLVGATPTRGVFQVDGWGWNRIGFGYAAYTHEWGTGRHAADTRIFMIEYDDFRHILKTDNRALAVRRGDLDNIRIDTFGGHTLHTLETNAGTLYGLFWGAVQTGRWGVQRQRAGAFDTEAGFQLKALPKVHPLLGGGYTFGSGDGNPNDNTHGTFFQVLPTPRPYARFPFFNMMNNEDAYGLLTVRPRQGHDFERIPFPAAGQRERSLVQRRRRVPAVDVRLHGPRDLRAAIARQPLRFEFRIPREPQLNADGLFRLCAGPGGHGADLPAG